MQIVHLINARSVVNETRKRVEWFPVKPKFHAHLYKEIAATIWPLRKLDRAVAVQGSCENAELPWGAFDFEIALDVAPDIPANSIEHGRKLIGNEYFAVNEIALDQRHA